MKKERKKFPNDEDIIITSLRALLMVSPEESEERDVLLDYIEENLSQRECLFATVLPIFCISQSRRRLSAKNLGILLDCLTKSEKMEGGPYYSSPSNKKIDIATNILICCCLQIEQVLLPSLDTLIRKSIQDMAYESDYCNEIFTLFILSHDIEQRDREKIIEHILKAEKRNEIEASLSIIALRNLGYDEHYPNIVQQITYTPLKIITLPDQEIFLTPALTRLIHIRASKEATNVSTEEVAMLNKINTLHDAKTTNLGKEMKLAMQRTMQQTEISNTDKQMLLMPYYIRELLKNRNMSLSDDKIAEHCLHNIYFWNAFIIYDDFWDEDEKAAPQNLPIANFFHRNYISYCEKAFRDNRQLSSMFNEWMSKMEEANHREISCFRTIAKGEKLSIPKEVPEYGDYTIKFWPSSGHAIISLAALVEMGYTPTSSVFSCIKEYFIHYLVARQISDDLHDWKEDLDRGNLSIVTTEIIRLWKNSFPEEKEINLKRDYIMLTNYFWRATEKICNIALSHLEKANKALSSIDTIKRNGYLYHLLIKEKGVISRTLSEKRSIEDMIKDSL